MVGGAGLGCSPVFSLAAIGPPAAHCASAPAQAEKSQSDIRDTTEPGCVARRRATGEQRDRAAHILSKLLQTLTSTVVTASISQMGKLVFREVTPAGTREGRGCPLPSASRAPAGTQEGHPAAQCVHHTSSSTSNEAMGKGRARSAHQLQRTRCHPSRRFL